MRAVLHIGTEKTGTTSIQEFLDHNRARLGGRGYHVLASAGAKNHRWVPSYCMADDRTDDWYQGLGATTPEARRKLRRRFRARFEEELADLPPNTHTLVVSSEHFHSRLVRQAEVDAVRDLLADHVDRVEIICYLREQVDMCASLYSTAIKVGQGGDFQTFLEQCTPDNIYYDYDRMLGLWESTFGRDALQVELFDRDRMLHRDLLDDLSHRIGPSLVGRLDKGIAVENESLSYPGQVLGRALNRAVSQGAVDAFIRREGLALISDRLAGKGEQADPERRREIQAAFAASNEAVRRRFFPEIDTLFAGVDGPVTDRTVDDRFGDTLLELMSIVRLGGAAGGLPDEYADTLRDVAELAARENPRAAYRAMLLASAIRPGGERIRRKLAELRAALR